MSIKALSKILSTCKNQHGQLKSDAVEELNDLLKERKEYKEKCEELEKENKKFRISTSKYIIELKEENKQIKHENEKLEEIVFNKFKNGEYDNQLLNIIVENAHRHIEYIEIGEAFKWAKENGFKFRYGNDYWDLEGILKSYRQEQQLEKES